jgi:hypothetical protein
VERLTRKIYHHHTPRFYLLPWADAHERLWWLGYGKICCSGLTVVGGQNNFYRLEELSEKDQTLLAEFITRLPYAVDVNLRFLKEFTKPHRVQRKLRLLDPSLVIDGTTIASRLETIDGMISNFVEDYHAGIENSFRPFLASMLNDDLSFYDDPKQVHIFLYGLMVQFVRTLRPREIIGSSVGPFDNPDAVWNLMHHMIAASTGASFFLDRKQYKLVLIHNRTIVPFVTSDQPIINFHADPTGLAPPASMEFYYPLSPAKAMLFLNKDNALYSSSSTVSVQEARTYNRLVAAHSRQQVFANSKRSLEILQQKVAAEICAGVPKRYE